MKWISPRTLLERLSRGKAFWRRMPQEFGRKPIRVTPDSALSFLKPGKMAFDPMLLRFVDEFVEKGQVIWDAGANVGVFSLAAAVRGGKVLAIEADPWLCSLLHETVGHPENGELSIDPLCGALSDRPGISRFHIAQRGRSASFIEGSPGSTQTGGVRKSFLVPTFSMDFLLEFLPAPSIVKIDVEGAEDMVIAGASDMLDRIRPILLVEVQKRSREKVLGTLMTHGYRISDYESGQECGVHIPDDAANFLAVPVK